MDHSQITLDSSKAVKYAAHPPLATFEILGYVKDENGEGYSRDIGRSFELGGKLYYLFGDTFCKKNGEYVGLQNNTCAIIPDIEQPLQSKYLDIKDNGIVQPLVPFNDKERNMIDSDDDCERITLWGFGGVCEISHGVGLHFCQKGIIHPKRDGDGDNISSYEGIQLARVFADKDAGKLTIQRCPGLLFGKGEPRMGSFSTYCKAPYLYLWGECGEQIYLGRVIIEHVENRKEYKFWSGEEWVQDWHKARPVFECIPQGAIFRSTLFGPLRPWVMIGCSKWADSKIWVGTSPHIHGPWELHDAAVAEGIDQKEKWMYCIYPHTWTIHETEPELMITWSEHWPGGVIAAKLKFVPADDDDGQQDKEGEEDESRLSALKDGVKEILRGVKACVLGDL